MISFFNATKVTQLFTINCKDVIALPSLASGTYEVTTLEWNGQQYLADSFDMSAPTITFCYKTYSNTNTSDLNTNLSDLDTNLSDYYGYNGASISKIDPVNPLVIGEPSSFAWPFNVFLVLIIIVLIAMFAELILIYVVGFRES